MARAELIGQKAFLGREFLTWLWYRSEEDPRIELTSGKSCEVEFGEQLMLEAGYGDARSSLLRGESPAASPEAAAALIQGKKVRRARVKLNHDGTEFAATLDGDSLAISSLKMPAAGKLPFDEVIQLRLEYASEFDAVVESLFLYFLEIRLNEEQWKAELKTIHKWAKNR